MNEREDTLRSLARRVEINRQAMSIAFLVAAYWAGIFCITMLNLWAEDGKNPFTWLMLVFTVIGASFQFWPRISIQIKSSC